MDALTMGNVPGSRFSVENPSGHSGHLVPKIKTVRMIGGLGPESSIDYYRSILAGYRSRTNNRGYPQIIINSLDVDKGIAMLDANRLDDLADYLATGVEALVRAGADLGFIAANT